MPADSEHKTRVLMSVHTDGCLATRGPVLCRDFQKTIRIDLESGDEFSLTARHGRNPSQLEFAEQTIVTALSPLSFVAVTTLSDTRRT